MKIIVDVSKNEYNAIVKGKSDSDKLKLSEVFKKGHILSEKKKVTNGDVFKAMFPYVQIKENKNRYDYEIDYYVINYLVKPRCWSSFLVRPSWWNKKYFDEKEYLEETDEKSPYI